jgi:DNA-binding transcriptional LysR family regulator
MNLDRLKAFCLVAQNGGLLRAAQKLKLSPATVSLRLKHLDSRDRFRDSAQDSGDIILNCS